MAKPKGPDFSKNLLFYGDNLGVMREYLADESSGNVCTVDAATPIRR